MKDILVIWSESFRAYQYSLPYNPEILKAHSQFIGSGTEDTSVDAVLLMIRRAKALPPDQPIDASQYSYIIICGILSE